MRSIIVSLLLVVAIKSSAQVNIISPTLVDSSLNYLYIAVENWIKVTGLKMSPTHKITASNVIDIQTRGNNEYVIRAVKVTDSSIVKIYDGKKEIFSKQFKVRMLSETMPSLAGKKDTVVAKNRVLANPFLAIIPTCYFKESYKVLSFEAAFINGVDTIFTFTEGNILSKEQLQLVKEAQPRSRILFSKIRTTRHHDRGNSSFWIKIE